MAKKSRVVYTDFRVPSVMLRGIQIGPKRVHSMGTSGAIYIPKKFRDKNYYVVLLPVEEVHDNGERKEVEEE